MPGVLLLAVAADAQVCRLSVAGLNRERRVAGPVSAECPGRFVIHTSPFGNWGVTSNYGPKLNGHQFQGWCRDTFTCDNDGNCRVNCRDGWYEWNSCTTVARYSPPNCTLYNTPGCMEQVSTQGINVLGTQTVDVAVRCPIDRNGDGVADEGGCKDVTVYSHGDNFMSLYELDPGGPDELVQTLHFPATPVPLSCGVQDCPAAGSNWVAPSFVQSPSAPAKVYAELATVVNFGVFVDAGNVCRAVAARHLNAASYAPGALAPGSLVAAFGERLAAARASAPGTPLPRTLAGTSVSVTDSSGAVHEAGLLFVSPNQVNYEMPPAAAGAARIIIRSEPGGVQAAAAEIGAPAPGLFTANSDGRGPPAANAVRVRAGGAQEFLPVFLCAAGPGSCTPAPIPLGPEPEQIYLILYGTGIRGAATVSVRAADVLCPVTYAGPQGQYGGLDQVNVLLPRELAGRGTVTLSLTAGGKSANPVTVRIQ